MDNYSYSFRHNCDDKNNCEFSSVVVLYHQDWLQGKKVKLIGKLSEILKDEDICKRLVFQYIDYKSERERLLDEMYEDYLKRSNYWAQNSSGIKMWAFKKATDSFLSYLQSIDLNMTKQYLFIQKF